MRISDWSSDVCSSDLVVPVGLVQRVEVIQAVPTHSVCLCASSLILARERSRRGSRCAGNRPVLDVVAGVCDQRGVKLSVDVGTIGELELVAEAPIQRSEEHTSELTSLMRITYAVSC